MLSTLDETLEQIKTGINVAVDRHEKLKNSQSAMTRAHLDLLYSDCLHKNVSLCSDTTDLNSHWGSNGLDPLFLR
jgi:hypothetical protein